MLSNVHQQFGLSVNKIVGIVTDNASNFGKAFRIFSFDKDEIEEELEYLQNEDNIVIFEFELPNNFDGDLEEFALPIQYRCISHTLNLIATTDSRVALSDIKYKKLYNSSFSKASALQYTDQRRWQMLLKKSHILNYKFLASLAGIQVMIQFENYYRLKVT